MTFVGMWVQIALWAMIIPRVVSRRTWAVFTFSTLPEDPDW